MPIQTICKNCIFAKFNEKNVQVGCIIDRLDKFSSLPNIKVLTIKGEEKEYFLIEDRICNTCRDETWAKKHQKDIIKDVFDEIQIRYLIIVLANDNWEDITKTIQSIHEQSLPVEEIVLVRKQDSIFSATSLSELLANKGFKHWRLGRFLTDNQFIYYTDGIVGDARNTNYYMSISAGKVLHRDTFKKIDKLVNEELVQFSLAYTDDMPIIPTAVHYFLDGNKERPLLDKINEREDKIVIHV